MPVFNCSAPGNCFTGYERLRRSILSGLAHGKSYAILGGRRCGKSSLLLQLEKDLQGEPRGAFNLQPRFLDIQALGQVTPERLFKAMLKRIAPGLETPPSLEPGNEYEAFLEQLDEIQPQLRKEHGNDWLMILLVDELDAAIASLPNDQFFQNLRNLLMVSRYNRHFRLVASGVREMGRLISSGSSPLNNLSHQYLRPLEKSERNELVRKGFPGGLPDPLMEKLEDLCGGHPYVWQGLLEKLESAWEVSPNECSPATVERAGHEFLREHKDFRRWLDGFTAGEREVELPECQRETNSSRNSWERHPKRLSMLPRKSRCQISKLTMFCRSAMKSAVCSAKAAMERCSPCGIGTGTRKSPLKFCARACCPIRGHGSGSCSKLAWPATCRIPISSTCTTCTGRAAIIS